MLAVTLMLCTLILGAQMMPVLGFDCQHRDKMLMAGESYQLANECTVVTCHHSILASISGCLPFEGSGECKKLETDVNAPFPECCPRYECVEPKKDDNVKELDFGQLWQIFETLNKKSE